MNHKEQNRLCVGSVIVTVMKHIEDHAPPSVVILAQRVARRSVAAIASTPPTETKKELETMRRRIDGLERLGLKPSEDNFAIRPTTSALLAMVDTVITQTNDNELWIKLQRSLFSLHKYYDRKLNNYNDYKAGAAMAYRWENFI